MFLLIMVRLAQAIISPASDWTGHGTMPAGTQAISIVVLLLGVLVVWLFWQGRYWARQFVFGMSCVAVAKLLYLRETWSWSHTSGYLTVAAALLGAFLLWYLETRAVRAWFIDRYAADRPAELDSSHDLTIP
jgi:hypothetical protein